MAGSGMVDRFSVETPESVSFAFDFADVGSRGVAAFLDAVFLGLIILAEVAVAFLVRPTVYSLQLRQKVLWWQLALMLLVVFLTYWGYYLVGEVVLNGRTPGKRIVGIRVVRDDGSRVNVLDSLIRNLLRLIDGLPTAYGIGVAAVLLSSRRKRLGDMAAGTVVVRDAGDLSATFEGGDATPRVMLAREYLRRRESITPEARLQVAPSILRAFAKDPAMLAKHPALLSEDPALLAETEIAARLAELSGARSARASGAH